jgi:hypothetical protein
MGFEVLKFESPGKICVNDPLMEGNDPGREVVVELEAKDKIRKSERIRSFPLPPT